MSVRVEQGMIRVSFWFIDSDNVGPYGDEDYVLTAGEQDAVYERRDELIGSHDEGGGNYLILTYDTLNQAAIEHDRVILESILRSIDEFTERNTANNQES